ncbi:hypothetical protein [Streptomyces xiamenensis]|uniref:hypothetical protein n=1 Tax=Streptomyces xiamenensis TaxID=408015 RepID=UPI003D7583D4
MTATTFEGRRAMERVSARQAAAAAAEEARVSKATADAAIEDIREKAADRKRRMAETAKTKKEEERAKRRERRIAARTARLARIGTKASHPLPWVMVVVVASVAVAWPGQYKAMTGLGMWKPLALLVPLFIEGATWSMAWMRKWAVENDKPTGLYTVMTWVFALIAAGLNAGHHLNMVELAVTMALSSLIGVVVWEIYMHSQQHKVGGRGAAEIRLDLARRLRHPRVYRRAGWLRAATGVDAAKAWDMAWRQLYACEPGVTHRVLKRHAKRVEKVAGLARAADLAQFATPQELPAQPVAKAWVIDPSVISQAFAGGSHGARAARPNINTEKIDKEGEARAEKAPRGAQEARARAEKPQATPNNPPARNGSQNGTEKDGARQVRAARGLAADTARAATPEQAEAEREAARAWVRAQLAAGREPGWRDLQGHLNSDAIPADQRVLRGETWCRTRMREAQDAPEVRPVLTAVPA